MPRLPDTAHREQILEAAAQLFVERGFGGTSMQHIAEALGVTRTAVYYYFKNKEEILRSLVEEISVAASRRMRSPSGDANAAGRLRTLVRDYALLILAHPRHFRVLDRSESDLPDDLARVHRQAKRQILETFSRAVSDGIALGEFRDVDPRMAAFAMLGMCNWTSAWFLPDGRLGADQIADAVADFALHALKPDGRGAGREVSKAALIDRAIEDLRMLRRMVD